MRVARWGLGLFLVLAACGGTGADQRATAAEVDPNNAAFLAVVEGEVSVRKADGTVAPAVVESTLARSDTLVTGADGRVVVVLHNRHVVKLGTSLAKRVDTLAHFDDPPPSQDLAQLFEEALGADYERLGGKDKLERIAGWNARRASGETPAPVTRAEAPPPVRVEQEADEDVGQRAPEPVAPGRGSLDDAPSPVSADRVPDTLEKKKRDRPAPNGKSGTAEAKKAETRAEEQTERPSKKSKASESGDNAGGASVPKPIDPAGESSPPSGGVPAPDLADEWTLETGANGQVQRVKLPGPLGDRRAALARCLVESGKTALTLEVKGGTIRAARFGAQTAGCASALVGVTLPDVGDATVTVRLKK